MRLAAIVFSLAIAGCADHRPDRPDARAGISTERALYSGPDASQNHAAPTYRCDVPAARAVLGERFTPSLAERARMIAGARTIRVIAFEQDFTLEFLADRLNLQLNAAQTVVRVFCG